MTAKEFIEKHGQNAFQNVNDGFESLGSDAEYVDYSKWLNIFSITLDTLIEASNKMQSHKTNLFRTMTEYICKTGNFPGNDHWSDKWKEAYDADKSAPQPEDKLKGEK